MDICPVKENVRIVFLEKHRYEKNTDYKRTSKC